MSATMETMVPKPTRLTNTEKPELKDICPNGLKYQPMKSMRSTGQASEIHPSAEWVRRGDCSFGDM